MSNLRAEQRHPELHQHSQATVVSWLSPGDVAHRFQDSLIEMRDADLAKPLGKRRMNVGPVFSRIAVESGPRIASTRNQIVARFLEAYKQPWLLMIDTDMVFDPTVIEKLFEVAHPTRVPIVGALCFGGGHSTVFPTMYRIDEEKGRAGENPVETITDFPENALVKVDATGAAFLLMHRDALAKIGAANHQTFPWFSEGAAGPYPLGEDWMFCLRAGRLGIPIHVHTGATVGHIKPVVLDEALWRANKTALESVGT